MWKTFKNIFPSKKKEGKHQDLNRHELLAKSAQGSTMAVRRFHEALDRLAEYDRQQK